MVATGGTGQVLKLWDVDGSIQLAAQAMGHSKTVSSTSTAHGSNEGGVNVSRDGAVWMIRGLGGADSGMILCAMRAD